MKRKSYCILIILCTISALNCFAQSSILTKKNKDLKFINNKTLKYSLFICRSNDWLNLHNYFHSDDSISDDSISDDYTIIDSIIIDDDDDDGTMIRNSIDDDDTITPRIMFNDYLDYQMAVFLSEKKAAIIETISYEVWMELLNNKSSDYAANIILYSIYGRYAAFLYTYNTAEKWRKCGLKNDDVRYWKTHLKDLIPSLRSCGGVHITSKKQKLKQNE